MNDADKGIVFVFSFLFFLGGVLLGPRFGDESFLF